MIIVIISISARRLRASETRTSVWQNFRTSQYLLQFTRCMQTLYLRQTANILAVNEQPRHLHTNIVQATAMSNHVKAVGNLHYSTVTSGTVRKTVGNGNV